MRNIKDIPIGILPGGPRPCVATNLVGAYLNVAMIHPLWIASNCYWIVVAANCCDCLILMLQLQVGCQRGCKREDV